MTEQELRQWLETAPCGQSTCKCAKLSVECRSLAYISMVVGRACPGVRAIRREKTAKAYENIKT